MKTSKSKEKKPQKDGEIDVRNFIVIEMIFSGDKTTGWVHTHGMWEVFGLPDLEILNVNPLFLMPEAGGMLSKGFELSGDKIRDSANFVNGATWH